jgi:hypothetical protein
MTINLKIINNLKYIKINKLKTRIMIEVILGWLIFSIIIGALGANRKIGFVGAFFLSLLLSPLIGLIIALTSKSIENEKYETEILEIQKKQQVTLENISQHNVSNIADDLKKIKELLDSGVINHKEFEKMKTKLMNSFDESTTLSKKTEDVTLVESDKSANYSAPEIKSESKVIENSMFSTYEKIEIEFKDGVKGILFYKDYKKEFYIKDSTLYGYKINLCYDEYTNCVNALHYLKTKRNLLKKGYTRCHT